MRCRAEDGLTTLDVACNLKGMAETHDQEIGKAVEALWGALLGVRAESNWAEKLQCCAYMHHRDDYHGTEVQKRVTYDDSAVNFLKTFCDGFAGYLMPRDDNWGQLFPWSDSVGKIGEERRRGYAPHTKLDSVPGLLAFNEDVSSAVLAEYARSSYYGALQVAVRDYFIMGTCYMMAKDQPKKNGVTFKVFDPQEVCIAEDADGQVEVFVRKFRMDAVDLVRGYPDVGWKFLKQRVQVGGYTSQHADIEVYEAIVPADYLWLDGEQLVIDGGKHDYGHVLWVPLEQVLAFESGYDDFPVACARNARTSDHTPYGRGLVELNLATIKKLDNLSRECLRMVQLAANPPLALPFSMEGKYQHRPGEQAYVTDMAQRPQPIQDAHSYPEVSNMIADLREQLRANLGAELFRTILGSSDSRKTAYEVSEKKNEAQVLLMLSIGNFQTEFIEPLFKRTTRILYKQHKLPSIVEAFGGTAEGDDYGLLEAYLRECRLELSSVFVRRLEAYTNSATLINAVTGLLNLKQIFPTAEFNVKETAFVREVLAAYGVNRGVLEEQDAVEKKQQAYAQMQAQQMQAQQAQAQAQASQGNAAALSDLQKAGLLQGGLAGGY